MKLHYLYHSSFLLEDDDDLYLFDYYKDKPWYGTVQDGVFNPQEWPRKRLHVFVSHRHGDHFNPVVFSFHHEMWSTLFYLSEDVVPPRELEKWVTTLHPGKICDVHGIKIASLQSNDEGVAFLLKLPNATVFYAGDLNIWDWPGDDPEVSRQLTESFQEEIENLKMVLKDWDRTVDIAFVPLDPRLEQNYDLGVDYFMRHIRPHALVPMHMEGKTEWIEKFIASEKAAPYADRIATYAERGDRVELPEDVELALRSAQEQDELDRQKEKELRDREVLRY